MKVSLNLVKFINSHYKCGTDPYSYGVDEIIKRTGAQLGAVEDVVFFGKRYDGIVVAKVVDCIPHNNSDHLSVCLIDDGRAVDGVDRNSEGFVQVVCGAPNVHEGLTVAWIPPKATVPSTADKDPLILDVREIRGKVSNGMLASPAELSISDNHDGILEIDISDVGEELCRPGTEFKKLYGLDDVVIDCENKMFTHRPDCFGALGVAREIAGIFGDHYKSPDWYRTPLVQNLESRKLNSEILPMSVDNKISDLVPRFMMQAVSDVVVKPSPMWLQTYLARVGVKSISNIVDYTNYFMTLTAQPTHAFDYDKVVSLCGENPVFAPRLAKKGEKLSLLNGKTIDLSDQDMVITANDRPIALAGVMGGAETEVGSYTKNIVIECATFDMYAVRRTSMRHGLFTDAVTRFTKGQSPLQNDKVLAKIVDEIVQFASGKVASKVFDVGAEVVDKEPVSITAKFINTRLGSDLSSEQISEILKNVEFETKINAEEIVVTPPFWRQDIEIAEDLVEEVGRLYGYDKLPVELPARNARATSRNANLDNKAKIRNTLSAAGANEIKSYSFIHGNLMSKCGISEPDKWSYHLRNAISPDLQYYRPALMPSLLDKVQQNVRSDMVRGDDNEFALFEVGRVHIKDHLDDENLPKQMERLGLVVVADKKTADSKYMGSSYYWAVEYLNLLTNGQHQTEKLKDNDYPITAPYQIGRSAMISIDGQVFGVIGEFRPSVKKALKLPEYCAGFELDLNVLKTNTKQAKYHALSTFPKTMQDITFEVDSQIAYKQLFDNIADSLKNAENQYGYTTTIRPRDIFAEKDSQKKRITYRIWISHKERTLVTEEINRLLDEIAKAVKVSLKAERI